MFSVDEKPQIQALDRTQPLAVGATGGKVDATHARRNFDAHRENLTPFVWTNSGDDIVASIARFAQRTADAQARTAMSRTMVMGH